MKLPFFHTKRQELENVPSTLIPANQTGLVPIQIISLSKPLQMPQGIIDLLWIADGKYKNYDIEKDPSMVFSNELFRITCEFKMEHSLIFTGLPVDMSVPANPQEKIGYFPSYAKLSPSQKATYLMWLTDISQPIDIGYVFIFYYGLERHLAYGRYHEAIDMIFRLRHNHKNNSFNYYSASALVMSAILRKDPVTLSQILDKLGNEAPCDNLVLLGKYLLKVDLTAEELVTLSNHVGFSSKKSIKDHPIEYKDQISKVLMVEFGKSAFPFYNLMMQLSSDNHIVFANVSFDERLRSPNLPSILNNDDFKQAVNKILSKAYEQFKSELKQQRVKQG